MPRIPFAFFLCLASASAAAMPNEVAPVAGHYLIGQAQESAIERELSSYLDNEDIDGAYALVERRSTDGDIDKPERRALEDRIWRTKTELTLEYARKIREAIRGSDLDMMRDYNARMQRLIGNRSGDEPSEPIVETEGEALAVETEAVTPELTNASETVSDKETDENVIADLLRRGDKAIAEYHLTIAAPGEDSALGLLDELLTLGSDGEESARILGRKVMATYALLIESDIGRGRLDKAETFTERMRMVAAHVGLPIDEVDELSARIDQISARIEEHDRLLLQAASLRDRGQLTAPSDNHALAFVARALKLDVDPTAANDMLDSIILRQRQEAERLAEADRLRDAARELETLASTLLQADIDKTRTAISLRGEAAELFLLADLRDSERERQAAAEAAARDNEGGSSNPLTFINPF